MIYQRISLATSEPVGDPGPLPFAVAGWPAELVADLSGLDPAYELTDAGFWPVVVPEPPAFDPAVEILSEGALVADAANKRFVRQWVLSPVPLETRKAAKRAGVSALLDAKLTGGYLHDFGAPHGEKRLQTRNIEDRTNWLTSQASYSAAVAAGAGAVMGAAFRTEDNINITLSYADGLDVLLAMAAWGAGLYAKSWALKDTIAAAEDGAALDAIDIEAGW